MIVSIIVLQFEKTYISQRRNIIVGAGRRGKMEESIMTITAVEEKTFHK